MVPMIVNCSKKAVFMQVYFSCKYTQGDLCIYIAAYIIDRRSLYMYNHNYT